jgi:predicted phosphohydrolase
MIVQYCSDLHLEFRRNQDFLKQNPLEKEGDVLILSGDVTTFNDMGRCNYFFDYLSDHFEMTFWIPGNHEYYYSDIRERSGVINERLRDNLFLVNNCSIELNGTQFLFSTLWSHINTANEWTIQNSISDFKVIKANGSIFSVTDFNRLHEEAMAFIRVSLKARNQKTIVATHHVPTFLHYPEKYKGDVLNEAFATELFSFIEQFGPDYWIYGHHHCNVPEFEIGRSKMVTNQLGYVQYGEHENFNKGAHFLI